MIGLDVRALIGCGAQSYGSAMKYMAIYTSKGLETETWFSTVIRRHISVKFSKSCYVLMNVGNIIITLIESVKLVVGPYYAMLGKPNVTV